MGSGLGPIVPVDSPFSDISGLKSVCSLADAIRESITKKGALTLKVI